MRLIVLLLASLLLTACGQSGQKSKVEVTTSFVFGGANMAQFAEGGLMVWGRSNKGRAFGRVLNDTDTLSLELDNGNWTFTAVAWDNNSSIELDATKLRCARSAGLELSGDPVSLNLQLTEANCQVPLFKASATDALKLTQIRACRSTSAIANAADECNQSWSNTNWKDYKAPVMSARLRLISYDRNGTTLNKLSAGLSSTCVTFGATGSWNTPSSMMIPVGDPANPLQGDFATELELHVDTYNCSDANPFRKTFTYGIAGGAASSKYFTANTNTNTQHRLFVQLTDSEVCAAKASAAGFAGGDGSDSFPHLICSAQQLYHFVSGDLTKSYRLMADIDLNPYTKGLSHSLTLPANANSCWREGQNWQPAGFALDGVCARTLTTFTGNFEGGGHEIKHLRTSFDQYNDVGFIAQWDPSSAGRWLRDLRLTKLEVEGKSNVGALLGYKATTNMGNIHAVTVKGADVRARRDAGYSKAGGVVGDVHNASLENIRVEETKVRGDGDRIGGIAGSAAATTRAKYLFVKQSVVAMESSAASDVGGIFGLFETATLQTNGFGAWSSDAVVVGALRVGGLIGYWQDANQPLEVVYSTSAVSGRGQASNNIGGLFGEAPGASGASLSEAYFAGSVANYPLDSTCGGTCNLGHISGVDGAPAISLSSVYVMGQGSQAVEGSGDYTGGYVLLARANTPSTGSLYNLTQTTALTSADWIRREGDLPRLVKEEHPCSVDPDATGTHPRMSLAQQNDHWGTIAKPLVICHKDQFLELTTQLGADQYAVLEGGVNLGGAYAPVTLVAEATLSGKNGFIQGLRNLSVTDGANMAPFAFINGSLRDLTLANIVLQTSTVASTTRVSGLAHTNGGTIKRVHFSSGQLSHADLADVELAGLVHTNLSGKTISDSSFHGILSGPAKIAGISWSNAGVIERVRAGGDIRVQPSFDNVAGIANVNTNTGTLQAVEVTSRLSSTSAATGTSVSMGVLTNAGSLFDTAIGSEAQWNFNFHGTTGNVVQLALSNTGTIKRAVVSGELFDQERNSASFTINRAKLVGTNTGTITGVFAVPTGRQVVRVDGTNVVSCSASTLTFNANSQLDVTSTVFDGGFFDANLPSDDDDGGPDEAKIVWLKLRNNGEERWVHVSGGSVSTGKVTTLELADTCSNLGLSPVSWESMTLLHAPQSTLSAALGNLAVSPFNGFSTTATPFDALLSTAGSPWLEDIPSAPLSDTVVADTDTSEGLDWVIDYYIAVLTGQTPPVAPIWEIDDEERLELFEVSK